MGGLNNMENKRIVYFDVLKFIAIFLVVYVHYAWISTSYSSNIAMILTTTAVPIFFCVNGALMLKKNLIKRHYLKKYYIL